MTNRLSNSDLQQRAEDLIINAELCRDIANQTTNFSVFMENYDKLLSCFKELADISRDTELQGINGNPSADYINLQRDAYRHMRDAIDRDYDAVLKECTTTYRDTPEKIAIKCNCFEQQLGEFRGRFDDETRRHASNRIVQLRQELHCLPANLNLPPKPELSSTVTQTESSYEIDPGLLESLKQEERDQTSREKQTPAHSASLQNKVVLTAEDTGAAGDTNTNVQGRHRERLLRQALNKLKKRKHRKEKARLEKQLADFEAKPPVVASLADVDSMTGSEFELWCAEVLRANGYRNVTVSGKSGDQGVDVLAEKDGQRYAIQCKCYSSSLGNSPVQEVYAGKEFYNCQAAAVMTNQHFTKGAQDLAQSTGVLLWDRDTISKMAQTAKRRRVAGSKQKGADKAVVLSVLSLGLSLLAILRFQAYSHGSTSNYLDFILYSVLGIILGILSAKYARNRRVLNTLLAVFGIILGLSVLTVYFAG